MRYKQFDGNWGGVAMGETLALSELPRVLRDMTGKRAPYARIYRMVVDGDLPAEKNASGRWFIQRQHLSTYADKLGLTEGAK